MKNIINYNCSRNHSFTDPSAFGYPIHFCIDTCDLLYLMATGHNTIDIAIDFYDADGRQLNNPGCDTMHFKWDFPASLCSAFDIDVVKTGTDHGCCEYLITLRINSCASKVRILKELSNALSFQSFDMTGPVLINSLPGLEINYSAGTISFTDSVCNASTKKASTFQFFFANKLMTCSSVPIDFSDCVCMCAPDSAKQDWFNINLVDGDGTLCGPGFCKVTATINIPSFYNCYTLYSINSSITKNPLINGGLLSEYNVSSFGCIPKNSYRTDTLKLYKDDHDHSPCVIINPVYCPSNVVVAGCTPDCDSVTWNRDTLDEPLPGCPNCRVHADYQWRRNTCFDSLKQDIEILDFATYSGNGDSSACNICGISEDSVHKFVLLKAIKNNRMGFNPVSGSPEGSCDDTWRVIQAACWVSYADEVFTPEGTKWATVHRPCDSTECCSIGLRVCRFSGNPDYITIDTLGGSSGGDICQNYTQSVINMATFGVPHINPDGSVSYFTFKTDTCEGRCNWLYGLTNNHFGYKISLPDHFDIQSNDYHGVDEIDVKIKILEDHLDFYVDSGIESGNLKIIISSINGANLSSDHFEMKKGENFFSVPTGGLRTGIYFISIQVSGLILKTEKFIIVK